MTKKVGPKEKKPFHMCGGYDITPGGIGNCVAAAHLVIILPVKDTAKTPDLGDPVVMGICNFAMTGASRRVIICNVPLWV